MKKIFAGVVLPTLAAVAVIGSGFSIWFFGENQTKVSSEASVQVEMLMRIGELKMKTEASTLHLDQTKDVRDFILDPANDYVNPNVDGKSSFNKDAFDKLTSDKIAANGLYLTANTTGANAFDGNISYVSSGTDIIEGAWKVEIVTSFKFTGNIRNFVGMKMDETHGTWKKETTADYVSYNLTWKEDKLDLSLSLPMNKDDNGDVKFEYLEYADQYGSGVDAKRGGYASNAIMNTAEAHNDAEYIALFNATVGSKLIIETTATIVADTTTGA